MSAAVNPEEFNGNLPGPVAGIDIGGTKIAIIVDADGAVLGRAPPSSVGDLGGAVASIAACLDEALGRAASGGNTSWRSASASLGAWIEAWPRDARRQSRLARLRPSRRARGHARTPVVIENDVRAAVGLYDRNVVDGAPNDLAYLAVGTGIAAGVVLDGKLHRGARGRPVRSVTRSSSSAGRAASAVSSVASRPSQRGPPSPVAPTSRRRRRSIRPRRPAMAASELVDDVGRRLAWAVHTLVMTYDVQRVVVGGGVSHAGSPFEAPLRRELERLRGHRTSPGSCCRPTSSMSCHRKPKPAWGAVAVARTAGLGPAAEDRRW